MAKGGFVVAEHDIQQFQSQMLYQVFNQGSEKGELKPSEAMFDSIKMNIKDALKKMSHFARAEDPNINVGAIRAFSEEKIEEVRRRK